MVEAGPLWPRYVLIMLGCFAGACAPAQYLAREDLGEAPPRTTVQQIIGGQGFPPDGRKARLAVERIQDGLKRAAIEGTVDDRDEWAVALIRLGRVDEAVSEMRSILTAHPGRTRTLHNLAVLQIRLGRYGDALITLNDLANAAPDYAQGLVDGMKAMAEYRRAQALRPDWSQRNLLTPELTAMWQRRQANPGQPPDRSEKSEVDKHLPTILGLGETLRRFPEFGDGWASLGVLHESRNDAYTAHRCYKAAINRGTGLRAQLDRHIRLLEPRAEGQNPARLIGPAGLWSLVTLVVAAVLFGGWRFMKAAREDLRQWKDSPDNKKKKGSYGPLGDKPLD